MPLFVSCLRLVLRDTRQAACSIGIVRQSRQGRIARPAGRARIETAHGMSYAGNSMASLALRGGRGLKPCCTVGLAQCQ